MKKIEMVIGEAFSKKRRDVLIISSVVIVISLAVPNRIIIPGLGSGVDLNPRVAFVLLFLAILYFFSNYIIEMRVVFKRNSEVVSGIAGIFDRSIKEKYDQLIDQFNVAMGILREVEGVGKGCRNFEPELQSRIRQIEREIPSEELPKNHREVIDRYNVMLNSFQEELYIANCTFNSMEKPLLELSSICQSLDRNFRRLSSGIFIEQRLSFNVFDRWIPILISIFALFLAFDGAFWKSWAANYISCAVATALGGEGAL